MEKFSPEIEYNEYNEKEPKISSIRFDGSHFGEIEKRVGTYEVSSGLDEWWQKVCGENNIDPNDKKLKNIDYYMIELGKNALECADGGEIKVIFEKDKITVVVTDQGQGFEDPNDDILVAPDHGLSKVKHYADEFIIETNSKKFTKVPKKKKLISSENTDVRQGSKITFVKKLELSK